MDVIFLSLLPLLMISLPSTLLRATDACRRAYALLILDFFDMPHFDISAVIMICC